MLGPVRIVVHGSTVEPSAVAARFLDLPGVPVGFTRLTSTTGSHFGLWRSLVAHLTGGQGVAGSNPVSPTEEPQVRASSPVLGGGALAVFETHRDSNAAPATATVTVPDACTAHGSWPIAEPPPRPGSDWGTATRPAPACRAVRCGVMKTARDVAQHHGVSMSFVVQAMAKLDVHVEPDSIAQCRAGGAVRSGLRGAHPDGQARRATRLVCRRRAQTADQKAAPRRRDGHVIRTAHTKIAGRKNLHTMEFEKVLAPEARSCARHRHPRHPRRRPLEGRTRRGLSQLLRGPGGPNAACGTQVKVLMGEEFHVARDDACPKCVERVRAGRQGIPDGALGPAAETV